MIFKCLNEKTYMIDRGIILTWIKLEEFRLEAYPLERVMCEHRLFLHNLTSEDYLVYQVSETIRSIIFVRVNHKLFLLSYNNS